MDATYIRSAATASGLRPLLLLLFRHLLQPGVVPTQPEASRRKVARWVMLGVGTLTEDLIDPHAPGLNTKLHPLSRHMRLTYQGSI